MKKELWKRGVRGFPAGVFIGYLITVVISIGIADGTYYPAAPQLIDKVGSEIHAVVLQFLLCGLVGTGFAMASVIWKIDRWSIVKQSAVYYGIICVIMMPVAYGANWMQHSVRGILSYFGVFSAVFLLSWIAQYVAWRMRVKRINDSLSKENE